MQPCACTVRQCATRERNMELIWEFFTVYSREPFPIVCIAWKKQRSEWESTDIQSANPITKQHYDPTSNQLLSGQTNGGNKPVLANGQSPFNVKSLSRQRLVHNERAHMRRQVTTLTYRHILLNSKKVIPSKLILFLYKQISNLAGRSTHERQECDFHSNLNTCARMKPEVPVHTKAHRILTANDARH